MNHSIGKIQCPPVNFGLTRRDAAKGLGLGVFGMLVGGGGALAQVAAPDLSFVHPELRPLAPRLMKMTDEFRLTPELVAMARRAGSAEDKPFRDDIPVTEVRVPVAGAPDILVYIVNSKPGSSRPAIVHMHGGGFILGTAKSSVRDAQNLAADLDCTVATVDYRLAPETRYAGSIEDNYAALRWVYSHAKELGIDPAKIAVMGESAGGGHAALLALTARDRGEVPVLFQCLIYPMLDDRTGSSRPPGKNIGTLGWTADSNRFGWEAFLGQAPGTPNVPTAAVPARNPNLSGLPPTFIGVGGIDLFVDESIAYAQRLIDAGTATQLLVQPGAFHGFDVFGATTLIGKRFIEAKMDALRRAFAGQFA